MFLKFHDFVPLFNFQQLLTFFLNNLLQNIHVSILQLFFFFLITSVFLNFLLLIKFWMGKLHKEFRMAH